VGLNDAQTVDILRREVRADQVVIDLVGIPGHEMPRGEYAGLCW
jgi:hypothetical protein